MHGECEGEIRNGEDALLPWDMVTGSNGIHSGRQCRAVSKVGVVGDAIQWGYRSRQSVLANRGPSLADGGVLVRRLGMVSRLAGFRKESIMVKMCDMLYR